MSLQPSQVLEHYWSSNSMLHAASESVTLEPKASILPQNHGIAERRKRGHSCLGKLLWDETELDGAPWSYSFPAARGSLTERIFTSSRWTDVLRYSYLMLSSRAPTSKCTLSADHSASCYAQIKWSQINSVAAVRNCSVRYCILFLCFSGLLLPRKNWRDS